MLDLFGLSMGKLPKHFQVIEASWSMAFTWKPLNIKEHDAILYIFVGTYLSVWSIVKSLKEYTCHGAPDRKSVV